MDVKPCVCWSVCLRYCCEADGFDQLVVHEVEDKWLAPVHVVPCKHSCPIDMLCYDFVQAL